VDHRHRHRGLCDGGSRKALVRGRAYARLLMGGSARRPKCRPVSSQTCGSSPLQSRPLGEVGNECDRPQRSAFRVAGINRRGRVPCHGSGGLSPRAVEHSQRGSRDAAGYHPSGDHDALVAASLWVRYSRRRVAAQPLAARAKPVSSGRLGLARSGGRPDPGQAPRCGLVANSRGKRDRLSGGAAPRPSRGPPPCS
jgi:hypothetical protein